MNTSTEKVIHELTRNLIPVRPAARPWIRTATWLGFLLPYVTVVFVVMSARDDLPAKTSDPRFLIEQFFALATGITAVMAAFASMIPGDGRRFWMWPLAPLAGWLGSLGEGCFNAGVAGITFKHDPSCFPYIAALGIAPGLILWIMLRRGAPLTPHLTAALGAVGAAGIANFCIRLAHPEDVTVMLLVWHAGGVLLLAALASAAGPRFLNWRAITSSARPSGR